MVTLTEVLEVNWIILYFVYGQVFFVTGLVTGLQLRCRSEMELARPLPWLAAFGIAHGLNEWGYIFIPLQAVYLQDVVVRLMLISHLLLLAVSFFFLFQFGVELLLLRLPRQRWPHALPGAMLLLWGVAVGIRGLSAQDPFNVLLAIGDGWSRYLLAFPGAILAGTGLLHQARVARERELPGIGHYLTGAAATFCIYALFGGLMVPAAPVFPASHLNNSLLDELLHLPAPVFRSVCGLGMAFFVVRSLEIFQVETKRRITAMEQTQALANDRERIGRELHDGIIQNLYAAGLGLEESYHLVTERPARSQQQIRAVMGALDQAIHDIRNYIFDLRTAEQTRELETILEGLVHDLRLDTLLEVELEVVGQRCCSLSSDCVAQLTQIAREALSNVVQHSGASSVGVTLTYGGDVTRLAVVDNGRGADLASLASNGHEGQGIANMRARARMVGGELEFQSQPDQGFHLTLAIPCGANACSVDELQEVQA